MEDGEYWKLQEPKIVNLLCNLKVDKIYNFLKNLILLESKQMITPEDFLAHLPNDMNFLRFMLKNSKVMELKFQLSQELLAFPRASRATQRSFNRNSRD